MVYTCLVKLVRERPVRESVNNIHLESCVKLHVSATQSIHAVHQQRVLLYTCLEKELPWRSRHEYSLFLLSLPILSYCRTMIFDEVTMNVHYPYSSLYAMALFETFLCFCMARSNLCQVMQYQYQSTYKRCQSAWVSNLADIHMQLYFKMYNSHMHVKISYFVLKHAPICM